MYMFTLRKMHTVNQKIFGVQIFSDGLLVSEKNV